MSDRTHLDDLLALYALDALDTAERADVARMIRDDRSLGTVVADHHEVLGVLAQAVETAPSTPSPLVWESIRVAIGGDTATPPVPFPGRETRRTRWFSRAAIALSATALVVSAFVGYQMIVGDASPTLQATVDELLRDPAATIVTMTSPAGAAVDARVIIGADGIGYVYADTLPVLGEDRTYQLWAIVEGADGTQVISAGVMGNDPGIAPFQVTGQLAGLAITNEIAGGVVSSQEEPTTLWLANA